MNCENCCFSIIFPPIFVFRTGNAKYTLRAFECTYLEGKWRLIRGDIRLSVPRNSENSKFRGPFRDWNQDNFSRMKQNSPSESLKGCYTSRAFLCIHCYGNRLHIRGDIHFLLPPNLARLRRFQPQIGVFSAWLLPVETQHAPSETGIQKYILRGCRERAVARKCVIFHAYVGPFLLKVTPGVRFSWRPPIGTSRRVLLGVWRVKNTSPTWRMSHERVFEAPGVFLTELGHGNRSEIVDFHPPTSSFSPWRLLILTQQTPSEAGIRNYMPKWCRERVALR